MNPPPAILLWLVVCIVLGPVAVVLAAYGSMALFHIAIIVIEKATP